MALSNIQIMAMLEKSLKYTPILYRQSTYSIDQNAFGNDYILEYKQTDIPEDSLLFFIPAYSSNDSATCKLTIRVPSVNSSGTYSYSDIVYDIIVEQNNDMPRKAGQGDIIANRMCIFRFRSITKQVILCNSPLYNDAIFSNVKVVNAKFTNMPVYVDPNTNIEYALVSTKELSELKNKVTALENKIKFGTQDPEEALRDLPAGTIYIQHEED